MGLASLLSMVLGAFSAIRFHYQVGVSALPRIEIEGAKYVVKFQVKLEGGSCMAEREIGGKPKLFEVSRGCRARRFIQLL